ncbi:MAG: hypothetical protein KF691_01825 [Phycisphaeraceae bacterium]|nr:hypothetical protein [Phycisphaeraceae bacterium]
MTTPDNTDSDSAIQRYEGVPNKPSVRRERSRWNAFLQWLVPFLYRGEDLLDDYLDAKVSEAQADAEIKQEKAAAIAAETDHARQKSALAFCDVIDAIAPGDSELARNLKLAKLLEANPGIMAQVERVVDLKNSLEKDHGARIEVVAGEPKSLPSAKALDEESDEASGRTG